MLASLFLFCVASLQEVFGHLRLGWHHAEEEAKNIRISSHTLWNPMNSNQLVVDPY